MPVSVAFIRELEEVDPKLRRVLLSMLEELEHQREESVTKKEFNELKEIVRDIGKTVKELVEAQKKTESRMNELEQVVRELAEAQRKSESRLDGLEQVVRELAEAQKRTEERINELTEAQKKTESRLDRLEQVVRELAEAQKRTEERVNELTEAQKKTESRLDGLEQVVRELAEAQKRTEEEIAKLSRGLQITREQLGGLSRSVGYALENEAYRHLPSILKKYYNIETIERLIRTYINNEEINIFGKAKQDGKEVYLVGEAVLKLDDRSKLGQVWDKVRVVKEEFGKDVVPVLVTHFARPDVLEKAKKAGIIVIQSFEWV
ncbi:hypothetical protein JCM12298_04010 [Desulfothermus naphthae]